MEILLSSFRSGSCIPLLQDCEGCIPFSIVYLPMHAGHALGKQLRKFNDAAIVSLILAAADYGIVGFNRREFEQYAPSVWLHPGCNTL